MARRVAPTYDILICSIAHRTQMLTTLLEDLGRQLVPKVGVRVYRDNLEASVGEKRQRLLDSSSADYVSFVDDDDAVHLEFVARIMEALRSRPDYVGFKVLYTEGGVACMPGHYKVREVYHSLSHAGWHDTSDALYRDISHLNPIRRKVALRAEWSGGNEEDRRWAATLRELGCVQTEVYIDDEMYWYRHRANDTFVTSSVQSPMPDPPARPAFDFVTWVK